VALAIQLRRAGTLILTWGIRVPALLELSSAIRDAAGRVLRL
jgi:hypothetical protein